MFKRLAHGLVSPAAQQTYGLSIVGTGIALWSVPAALLAVGAVVTAFGVSREVKAGRDAG